MKKEREKNESAERERKSANSIDPVLVPKAAGQSRPGSPALASCPGSSLPTVLSWQTYTNMYICFGRLCSLFILQFFP
jgi:hypothetical protein